MIETDQVEKIRKKYKGDELQRDSEQQKGEKDGSLLDQASDDAGKCGKNGISGQRMSHLF
jgi:hypothetical protein